MIMTKVYYTLSMKLNHSFKLNGKTTTVLFNGMIVDVKTKTFTTSDEEVQKALESCPAFGSEYWIGEIIEDKKEVKGDANNSDKGNEGKKEIEFENISQAKEFLHNEPYNIALNKMTSPAAIMNRGKELGMVIKIKS